MIDYDQGLGLQATAILGLYHQFLFLITAKTNNNNKFESILFDEFISVV
jgi:hypothetical protein